MTRHDAQAPRSLTRRVRPQPGNVSNQQVARTGAPGRHAAAIAGSAAIMAGMLTSCAGESPDPAATSGLSATDPGVEHVHALGVDPRDDVLYAATHYGLFRLPAGQSAERVADRYQDTMGFTITPDGTFLGSGHPDLAKDPGFPVRLGLIRSSDRAQTWKPVSLGGQADFHVLRASPGQIVGWDATNGELLVSTDDGQSWELRSTLALRDLVVDPQDPDAMLATTERGLIRSADGGRTFQALPSAGLTGTPAVLSWSARQRLITIDAQGRVLASVDQGLTWSERGSLGGSPEALLDDRGTLYAARDGAILASVDDGRSWQARYKDTAP